jgi:hypothetical protein
VCWLSSSFSAPWRAAFEADVILFF